MRMLAVLLLLIAGVPEVSARLVENVTGIGEAQIAGITAEQAQYLALMMARANAVEKAAGIEVLGTTVIRDLLLVGQFLKTFFRGYVVEETVEWGYEWIPQKKGPPIANYRATINAKVAVPDKDRQPGFLLEAELNRTVYFSGDCAAIRMKTSRPACVAVFNLRADDRVVMLHPGKDLKLCSALEPDKEYCFPSPDSGLDLEMSTFKGHDRDTEAFLVAAVPATGDKPFQFTDYFQWGREYPFAKFFEIYSGFADKTVEQILTYEVRRVREKQ